MSDDFIFTTRLVEGTIVRRQSQFTMTVTVDGTDVGCHCPTTGRIGEMDVSGRPCLMSRSTDPSRKTPYTVEAVSLDRPEDADKSWIGINQNAVNRYVEHYLRNGALDEIVGSGNDVHREVFLKDSKLDFLVGDTYLEVKMPLVSLQVDYPEHVRLRKQTPFSSTDRLVRHITGLADSLESHQKAVLLTCFVYDNPGYRVMHPSTDSDNVRRAIDSARSKGVEMWQVNFRIDPDRVVLDKYFRMGDVVIDGNDGLCNRNPRTMV